MVNLVDSLVTPVGCLSSLTHLVIVTNDVVVTDRLPGLRWVKILKVFDKVSSLLNYLVSDWFGFWYNTIVNKYCGTVCWYGTTPSQHPADESGRRVP